MDSSLKCNAGNEIRSKLSERLKRGVEVEYFAQPVVERLHPVDDHGLVAPVELEGFAQLEAERARCSRSS